MDNRGDGLGSGSGLPLDEPPMLSGLFEIRQARLNSTMCTSAAEGTGPRGKMPTLGRNEPGFRAPAGPWTAAVLKANR